MRFLVAMLFIFLAAGYKAGGGSRSSFSPSSVQLKGLLAPRVSA